MDALDDLDVNGAHQLLISNIPREITLLKLKKLLGRKVKADLWQFEELIPLEESNRARLSCASDDICKKFLASNIVATAGKMIAQRLQIVRWTVANESTLPQPYDPRVATMAVLNFDCLRYTFKKCSLKDQIALTKVCKYFMDIIGDIWRYEYQTLNYKLYDFQLTWELSAMDLQDFLLMTGRHVVKIIFDTGFYMQLLARTPLYEYEGNILSRSQKYTNVHFCKHLMYFENLQGLHVKGSFMEDFTIKELAHYCPDLSEFKMLDIGTHTLCGKHFPLLINLRKLSIKDCERFQRRYLRRICRNRMLRELSIVDCDLLIDAKFITNLCGQLVYVTTLKLTALEDEQMLATVLSLKRLRHLQISWLSNTINYEQLLVTQIGKYRGDSLLGLKFNNDLMRPLKPNTSLSPNDYALKRECNSAHGIPWRWDGNPLQFSAIFEKLYNLQDISFEYCRLCEPEYLFELPRACKNLKSVKLIGCRRETDDNLLYIWTRKNADVKCKLLIEGLAPAVLKQKLHCKPTTNKLSVLRKVECYFQ